MFLKKNFRQDALCVAGAVQELAVQIGGILKGMVKGVNEKKKAIVLRVVAGLIAFLMVGGILLSALLM